MRYRRDDVVARAVDVLDDLGLADLTMRRLATELGVQPSALYHHVANKQTLLAAVADEVLARGFASRTPAGDDWVERAADVCATLRDALLAYRDGAELVSTVWAFGLGARLPYDLLLALLTDAGLGDLAPVGARTLLHYVHGHALDEQTHLQAAAAGAVPDDPRAEDDFAVGLRILLAGLQVVHAAEGAPA